MSTTAPMAVEFSTRLQQLLGADFAIAPTLLFDYPTVNALTDYLVALIADLPEAEDAAPAAESPADTAVGPGGVLATARKEGLYWNW